MTEKTSPSHGAVIGNVLGEILIERCAQIEREGYSLQHDDQFVDGQLANAASCYACRAASRDWYRKEFETMPAGGWPFSYRKWKPKTRRQDLIRAAALIVAEIERLDRLQARKTEICAAKFVGNFNRAMMAKSPA